MITSPKEKSYIGQTIRPIQERLEEHRTGKSSGCRGIYNAIKKTRMGKLRNRLVLLSRRGLEQPRRTYGRGSRDAVAWRL